MKCIKKSFFLIPFQRFNRPHNLKNDYVQSPKAAVMYLNLNTTPQSYCKYFFSRFWYNLFTGSYFSVRLSRSKIYFSEVTGTDRDTYNVTSTVLHNYPITKKKKTIVNCHWQARDFTRKTASHLILYTFLFCFYYCPLQHG